MDRLTINLASGDYLKRRIVLVALYFTMAILVALIGIDLMQYNGMKEIEGSFDARISRVQHEKQQLQQAIAKLGRNASDDAMKSMEKEVQLINQLLRQKSFSWTTFLSNLESQVPSNISVTRIQPDFSNGQVILGGAAPSLKEVTEFVGRLQKEPFEDPFLMQQEDFEKDGRKGVNFSIRFKYNAKRGGV